MFIFALAILAASASAFGAESLRVLLLLQLLLNVSLLERLQILVILTSHRTVGRMIDSDTDNGAERCAAYCQLKTRQNLRVVGVV